MPVKRQQMPNLEAVLSPDTIKAILAKEALLRSGVSSPEGMLISSNRPQAYICFVCKWEDSATAHYARPKVAEAEPFGDEESLRQLFAEFAEEDRALANEGLAEFRQVMAEYDGE
jgi:hypothetical protein